MRGCETDFRLVECFDPGDIHCVLGRGCRLKGVFSRALQAFLAELDQATLADIIVPQPLAPAVVAVLRQARPAARQPISKA